MRIENHRLLDDISGAPVPYVQAPNRSKAPITPRFLILHYTAGGPIDGTLNWFKNPAAKASAHLVIGRDGRIVQMGGFDQWLYHAGRSRYDGFVGLNGHSIGIEICNWGHLTGEPGNWRTYTGQHIPDGQVTIATHRLDSQPMGWEMYPGDQYMAVVMAAQAICGAYDIPPDRVLGHDDISGYRGKRDPGPLFDLGKFRELVFGRGDASEGTEPEPVRPTHVTSARSGLNMRTEPNLGASVIKKLPAGTGVVHLSSQRNTWNDWRLVAEVSKSGLEDTTGWVHSNWLKEAEQEEAAQ